MSQSVASPFAVRRWVGGLALTALALAATLLVLKRKALVRGDAEHAVGLSRAQAYEQCAGNGISKECEEGCLCLEKNSFFSGCKPIPGEQKCNPGAVKGFIKAKKHHAAPLQRKKDSTEKTKKETADDFIKAAKAATKAQREAAQAVSMQQVVNEAATMEAVQHDNQGHIKKEVENVKQAKKKLEHTKSVAEKEAQVQVTKAEEALEKAKQHLKDVSKQTQESVANVTAEEKKKVDEAKEHEKKAIANSLGPALEHRKTTAAAAKKRAEETAEAETKARKVKADALKAKQAAAKAAVYAAEALKPAEKLVVKWKGALQ